MGGISATQAQRPGPSAVRCSAWHIHVRKMVEKASTAVRATKHHGNTPTKRRPSAHLNCATPNVKNERAMETNVHPPTTAGTPSKARVPNHEVPSHSTIGGKCPVTMADTPTQPGGITNTDMIKKTMVVCAHVGNCSSCKGMIFIFSAHSYAVAKSWSALGAPDETGLPRSFTSTSSSTDMSCQCSARFFVPSRA
jgi:hypothetical protein